MSVRISQSATQSIANHISKANAEKRVAQRQLASGVRIYAAAEDPAGIALSEKLRSKIQSLREAGTNIGQAQSMIRVAAGSTETVGGAMMRMRSLAVQAASGTLSQSERAMLQEEFTSLQDTIQSVANSTEFNGLDLADGSTASVDVQVGDMAGDSLSIELGDLQTTSLGVDAGSINIASQAGAESAIGALDQALDQVHSQAATYGSAYNRLSSSFRGVQDEVENVYSTQSRITDVDIAEASAQLARTQVLSNAGLAVMVQANIDSRAAAKLLS